MEITGKDGLEEGAEYNLSAIGLGQCHPENEDKLEGIVEGEPVHGADRALKDVQEGIDNPIRQPLGIVNAAAGEQSIQGVVCRDDEANGVHKELGSNVEENEEEVQCAKSEDNVDLGYVGVGLKIIEKFVFPELLIKLRNGVLSTVLQRHVEWLLLE